MAPHGPAPTPSVKTAHVTGAPAANDVGLRVVYLGSPSCLSFPICAIGWHWFLHSGCGRLMGAYGLWDSPRQAHTAPSHSIIIVESIIILVTASAASDLPSSSSVHHPEAGLSPWL